MNTNLMGFNINTYNFNEAVDIAVNFIKTGIKAQVITINPEMIECAKERKEFFEIINQAEMVIPDGVGITLALKLNGISATRIPGIDFAKKILEICEKERCKIAIIGSKQEVIEKAVCNLKNELKELNIAYFHNGYFTNDEEIIDDLIKVDPDLILVAMGSPRQEEFISNAKSVLDKGLMIGIGGSLDVWSGSIKRAPYIFRKTGTEWLYRTIMQPSRFKRIFPTLPVFLIKAFLYKFKKQES